MGETKITFTSDDKDVVKALERMQKEMIKLREEARKLSQESKRSTDDSKLSFDGLIGSIGKAAAAYMTLNTAINLVNAGMKAQQELEARAARAGMTVSDARQELIANLPGSSPADIRRTIADVTSISRSSGVDEAVIAKTVAQTLSASGGNQQIAVSAARIASRFLSHDPTAIPEFGGAMTDLSKVTGSSDMLVNLGAFAQAGATSRVVDPKKLATAAPSAAIGMKSFGATAQEGISFWSALTSAAADDEGRLSATGSIGFAEQLREFLPPGGVAEKTTGTGRKKKTEAARPGFGTFGERLEFLQQNPDMAKSFADTLEGEKRVKGPLEDLLIRPDSFMAKQYQKNLRAFPDDAGLKKLGQEVLTNKGIDPLFAAADTSRSADVLGQQFLSSQEVAGKEKAYRDIAENINRAALSGSFSSTVDSWLLPIQGAATGWESTARSQAHFAKGHLAQREYERAPGDTEELAEIKRQTVILQEMVQKLEALSGRKAVPMRQE